MASETVAMCEQSSRHAETQMHSDATISARERKRETAQRHNSQSQPFKLLIEEAERQKLELMDSISIDDFLSDQDNKLGIQAQIHEGDYGINQDTIINPTVEQQCNGNPRKYKKEKPQQESRRRLVRGPRSGGATVATETMQNMFLVPAEDHRVVSTEYQSSGTQVLMRVTLLAAGFVIGAKGNSARLIGQTTGAVVQSWTETNCGDPDAVPIRVFRIQGKKPLVQAAVSLIEQAVAKYRELCECKRRGEFVQREHVINGVEFYYQPPPKKALEYDSLQKLTNSYEDIQPEPHLRSPNLRHHTNLHTNNSNSDHSYHTNSYANCIIPPGFNRHYPKYPNLCHCFHGEKQNVMGLHIAHPLAFPRNNVWAMPQIHSANQLCNSYNNPHPGHDHINMLALNTNFKCPSGLFDPLGSTHHQEHQLNSSQNTSDMNSKEEVQVSNLEINKVHERGVDNQEEECSTPSPNENKVVDPWLLLVQQRHEQMSSSLFSFFGHGGLPGCVAPAQAQSASESLSTYDPATTGFDFSSYEFLGGRFPAFSFASAINSKIHPIDTVLQSSEEKLTRALSINQPAGLCFRVITTILLLFVFINKQDFASGVANPAYVLLVFSGIQNALCVERKFKVLPN